MDLLANLRKGLASITLTALASTFVVAPVQAANLGFTDDAEIPSWANEAIEELMDQGVVNGNDDGSFAPNRQLNRAEVSKIIVLSTGIDLDTTGGPHFPDVSEDAWYYDYIETMYNQGWINGYPDGYFRPGVGINRAEIAKMIVNAFELDQDLSGAPHFDDVTSADWFYGYVETAYNNGLMRGYGDGTFGPANAVTRAETIKIVYDSQLVVLPGPVTADGTLELVLSNDTPRGTNIPFNATSVPFTTLELTASDDADVEISSLTFTRLGLGDNDDFDNVWLEIDGFKVGNDKSINNDDVVELRFNPPIVVPAGQTLVADVVASLKYQLADDNTCFASGAEGCNIGHHNRLALVSAEDIVSTAANLAGDFPIEGEEMEVADYRVSEIKFSRMGSDTTVNVGDSFIEIGKFRMLNSSTTNKDVEIRAITFKNDGTAELEDDLENVSLYVSGEQVSAETIIDGDYVTFRLDNGVTGGYIVEDGDSRIFSVRADIVSAEKGDVLNFKVDNFEDIVGVEIGTAFGVKAISGDSNALALKDGSKTEVETTTACLNEDAEDSCARLRAYEIDAGDLNISRDPASLGNQEYAPGSNDVVAMTARLVVDQPIIVDGVRINTLEASTTNATCGAAKDQNCLDSLDELNNHFDNFRLFLDDKLIDTENQFSGTFGVDGAGTYLNFNTSFEIAGTSVLKLVTNIQDGAKTGSKLRVQVESTAFDSPEFISTGDQVTDIQGSAQASFVEVQESALTITKSDGLSSGDRIVAGVNDVTFLKFVLDNNDSGDVNATSVTIQAIGTGSAKAYQNFTAAVFVDGIQQGSSRNLDKDGSATFNDLSVVVPSAQQTEFEVVVDTLETSASSNPASTRLAGGINSQVVLGQLVSGSGTVAVGSATVSIGNTTTPTVTSGTLVALAEGDQIVVTGVGALTENGSEGNLTTTNAEIRTISAAAAVGSNSLSTTAVFNNGHPNGSDVYTITTQYPATTDVITVIDASKLAKGDVIKITGATGGVDSSFDVDAIADNFCVKAVSGNNVTLGDLGALTNGKCETTDSLGAVVAADAMVKEISAGATILLYVKDVDADNVENGQEVAVKVARTNTTNASGEENLGEATITTAIADTAVPNSGADGNCDTTTTANDDAFLCGVRFALVQSGQLTIDEGATIVNTSNILLAKAEGVEIFKLRLSAADDEVQIKDLYFVNTEDNDFGDRVDFKLYDDAGALIQEKQMTGTKLHFDLANQDRIRVPKDDSTTVTVKVDVRAITKANQTGQTLVLALSSADGTGGQGVEAVTAATGADLADENITVVDQDTVAQGVQPPVSDKYIAYRTMLTFANGAVQPNYAATNNLAQIFNFTVTNDVAYAAALNKLTFAISTQDTTIGAGGYQLVRHSSSNFSDGSPTLVAQDLAGTTTATFTGFSEEIDGTGYFSIRAIGGYQDAGSQDTSNITVAFQEDTAVSMADTAAGVTGNVIWTDRSNNGADGRYLNGYELPMPIGQSTGTATSGN